MPTTRASSAHLSTGGPPSPQRRGGTDVRDSRAGCLGGRAVGGPGDPRRPHRRRRHPRHGRRRGPLHRAACCPGDYLHRGFRRRPGGRCRHGRGGRLDAGSPCAREGAARPARLRPVVHEVDWEQARRLSHEAGRALAVAAAPPQLVPLDAAAGRVLARDATSLHSMPHYASSAMDGWVVAGEGPWRPEAAARPHATAGTEPPPLAPGTARRIVTGEAIPAGATTVVRQEHAVVDPGHTVLRADPAPREGADIRAAGREASAGDELLRAGMRLTPGRIAVAAVGGHDVLPVTGPVRVRLVLTGDEVVTSGIPAPGQVRDAFGPVLPACIDALGGTLVDAVRI